MSRSFVRMGLVIAVCAGMFAACGGDDESESGGSQSNAASGTDEQKPASIKVMLDWVPSPQQAGIHWAEEHGLFEEQDLDVTIQAPPDVTAPAKFVATNRVDLSVYYQPDLMLAKAEGLPLKAVGVIMERPLASVAYQPGWPDPTVESLKGQKVASFSLPMNKAMADTIFGEAGFTRDDVQWQELGFNAAAALRSKKVAATVGGFWTSNPEVPGAKYVPVDELGMPTYDEMIILANSERLESDADYESAVKRFLAAMNEGTQASLDDPVALYDLMKERTKTTDILQEETDLAMEAMTPPDGRTLGCLNPPDWDAFTEWMVEHELLEQPIATEDVATTEYVEGCPG